MDGGRWCGGVRTTLGAGPCRCCIHVHERRAEDNRWGGGRLSRLGLGWNANVTCVALNEVQLDLRRLIKREILDAVVRSANT